MNLKYFASQKISREFQKLQITSVKMSSESQVLKLKPVKAILFDMDGLLLSKLKNVLNYRFFFSPVTLKKLSIGQYLKIFFFFNAIDTEPVYEGAFKEMCSRYGAELTPEVRVKLLGSTERKSCEHCVNDLHLNVTLDEFVSGFRVITQQRLEHVDFLPGVKKLIQHLHTNKIPIAVATSSSAESVEIKTRHHQEIFKLFQNITKGTEVKEGKPAPDIFLLAASRLEQKIEPHEVSKNA